jgi:CubicO group peptidase (beta-lactamase class C family)
MRHTSGLIDAFGDSPVDRMYLHKNLLDPNSTLQDLVTKLTTVPLQDQPGTRFHYSVSTDVLGRLVEVISGTSLDVYFEQRIFKPLDMVDTGFYIPTSKADRFATNYGPAGRGRLKVIDDPAKSLFLIPPKFLSGGGGLVSTARDYTRFCQMLLDGGKLHGAHLLKPETIQLMTHNQLPPEALPLTVTTSKGDKGLGFGLGFAVRMAPNPDDTTAVVGEYHWGGAASTAFAVCPRNQTVLVVLAQHIPFKAKLIDTFKRAVTPR